MNIMDNLYILLVLLSTLALSDELKNNGSFPKNFQFGVATSAYQVEGAWNVDGKGVQIWDTFTHKIPSPIENGDTGDIACNSYYKYKEDVKLAAQTGVKLYRFSISWSRVLPNGYANNVSEVGLNYYKNLVKEILKYKMRPVATIYHWDLPQRLYDDGIHWANTSLIPHFVNYSRIVIQNLPDVAMWVTINEPKQICRMGYGTTLMAPGLNSSGVLEYQCSYVLIKTHATVYHMYKKEFPHYKAKMSIVIDCQWIDPLTNSTTDEEAAEREREFECGLYFNPIFNGDWPDVVRKRVDYRSNGANLAVSRLPVLTKDEINYIKGTHDFLGLNHYYTQLAREQAAEAPFNETSFENDQGTVDSFDPKWVKESNGLFVVVPSGAYKVLKWIRKKYGNQEIIITEIGMSDNGTYLNDQDRIDFYKDYFCNILEAMNEGVNVTGIIYWSLIDNFEWFFGYSAHFGLYHVNFNDPNRTRQAKSSAGFARKLAAEKHLSCNKASRERPDPVLLPKWTPDAPKPNLKVPGDEKDDHKNDKKDKKDKKVKKGKSC